MPKLDHYSPRAKVKTGMVMYVTDDILISPRYKPVVRVEKGTEVLILEVIRGESYALVRTRGIPPTVTGTVEFLHLTTRK
jgi:hypothetical protein